MNSFHSIVPGYGGLIDIRDEKRTVYIPKSTKLRINGNELFIGNDIEIPYGDDAGYTHRFVMVNSNNIITTPEEPHEWRTASTQDFICVNYKEVSKYSNTDKFILS